MGPSKVSSPGLIPGRIQERHVGAVDDGKLHEIVFLNIGRHQRHVRRAERDGLIGDLLDATARADRLIVEADPRLLFVGVSPAGKDRIDEGRARAGDLIGAGGNGRRRKQARDGNSP